MASGGRPADPRLVDGGLPVVLSQTFRTLIHSRLELGLKGYETSHPGTDIVLFEPDHRDPEMFIANLFGYAQRRAMAEHAYQQTREDLRERARRDRGHAGAPRRGARPRGARRPAAPPAARRTRGASHGSARRGGWSEVLDDLETGCSPAAG